MERKKIHHELVKYMKIRMSTQFTATVLILDGVDYYISATAKTCTKKVFSLYSFQKRTFLQLFGHTLIFSYNLLTKYYGYFCLAINGRLESMFSNCTLYCSTGQWFDLRCSIFKRILTRLRSRVRI